MDVNTKKLKKNAFRVTKKRGLTASRIRIPGGHLEAKYLGIIQDIAERYGDGSAHYRLTLFGRTGKRNPRLGVDFIKWIDEDSIIKIILNTYAYVEKHIDPGAPGGKEHIGYIVDRTGFEEYKRWALKDVTLPPRAEVNHPLYW
jgi:dissimilatory sulfite reductase (desulfoviridin) alpha/beta subunit